MSVTFQIEDTRGSRAVGPDDFPLTLGGPESHIAVAESGASALAHLGLVEGDLFVQPAGEGAMVAINDSPVSTSAWLQDGDVLTLGGSHLVVRLGTSGGRLSVRRVADDNLTRPPVLAPPAEKQSGEAGAGAPIRPVAFEPARPARRRTEGRRLRLWPWLTALLLLALGSAGAFVFTSRSVALTVEPEPDQLALEGGFALELGERRLLRSGSYQLRAEKAGYRPLAAQFEVTDAPHQDFRFVLEKLPGQLRVELRPEVRAEVILDGEAAGSLPRPEPFEMSPGEHEVRIRAARYEEHVARVELAGGGEVQTLEVELLPRWAAVTFRSEPSGAAVTVAGRRLGATPLTTDLLEGAHDYRLTLAGHKPHLGRVQVNARQATQAPLARLAPTDGSLLLESDPPGAAVTIAGTYRGETPLSLELNPGRAYEVRLSKAGYGSEQRSITLESGETREWRATLAPRQGEVRIAAEPADAELLIDGEPRGVASQTLRLTAVPHSVEIRKAGFSSHRQSITPIPDVPQSIEVVLEDLSRPQPKVVAEVIRTSEEQELRLLRPGPLKMGASRREPGRRANEALREVELTRPFYLGVHEVSNRQMRRFRSEHLSGQVSGRSLELDHHPAVGLTWQQAAAYCNWLSQKEGLPPAYVAGEGGLVAAQPMTTGYRLPSEAEWAWAARYGNGEPRKYPWGDSLPVPAGAGNYADASAKAFLPGALADYDDGFPVTAPVESLRPDGRGFYHLGGNVAEWVHDVYAIRPPAKARDPLGPGGGELHVIRGSSWMHSTITELRLTYRDYGKEGRPDVGFRLARYAE